MFALENSNGKGGPHGSEGGRANTAYEAKLAIVEYFEAVAANPKKFDREKLRALRLIWGRVPSPGIHMADLSQRLQAARLKIRADRELLSKPRVF